MALFSLSSEWDSFDKFPGDLGVRFRIADSHSDEVWKAPRGRSMAYVQDLTRSVS